MLRLCRRPETPLSSPGGSAHVEMVEEFDSIKILFECGALKMGKSREGACSLASAECVSPAQRRLQAWCGKIGAQGRHNRPEALSPSTPLCPTPEERRARPHLAELPTSPIASAHTRAGQQQQLLHSSTHTPGKLQLQLQLHDSRPTSSSQSPESSPDSSHSSPCASKQARRRPRSVIPPETSP